MKQEFKVRVRQYATGEIIALSHHELDSEQVNFDDVALNYSIGGEDGADISCREFDIVVRATPPIATLTSDVEVDVPDGADESAVDVPDPVPA
jgi:hypothetical protein